MRAKIVSVLGRPLAKEVFVANRVTARLQGEHSRVLAAEAIEVERPHVEGRHCERDHCEQASQSHRALK